MFRTTGISRNTITQGIKDLENPLKLQENLTRTRKPSGGRKRTIDVTPEMRNALKTLVEPITRGDPESPLRWTCKSLRTLVDELKNQGYSISHRMDGELLHEMGYSLRQIGKPLKENNILIGIYNLGL